MRKGALQVTLFLLCACDTRPVLPPPEPSPSASVSAKAAPIAPATVSAQPTAMASASASAEPPAVKPMPGIPDLDRECTADADCDKTYFDILCCNDCMPRIGNKTSIKKIDTFCKANKPKECAKPPPCGMVFGAPRCNGGKCIMR